MLIAKGGKSFLPPPEGVWPAVCVDVVDLGMVETQWGEKHKCRITWEISEKMDDGRPYIASKQYTVSLHEKSSLFKDLKSWRGKPFTPEELAGFDVEKVLGCPCQLVITNEEKDGNTYGNVTAILRANKKQILKPTGTYVRYKDRVEKTNGKDKDDVPGNPDYSDHEDENEYASSEEIPF